MELTMSKSARERIFARLQAVSTQPLESGPGVADLPVKALSRPERIEKLKSLMEAMRTEVHLTSETGWLDKLSEILKQRNVSRLLFGPRSPIGNTLQDQWKPNSNGDLPDLVPYDSDIEQLKDDVFTIDAGITSTYGGIAETGALMLWSSAAEPRLLSLVPPIHIAVLRADKIYNSFLEVIQKNKWADQMPTNAFLISGPSKTADIELTLAFGVHGPKELIVLVVE
jgi:L-lactate dehydrogenase complex protein LldG